ncbi:type 1 glutamine amidotransferase domain-containing protein [Paraoerskovia sediminicola]|nr:type 1 glutamine amidotransferase domain-containing protein [Paraoerskovia sediminicola]
MTDMTGRRVLAVVTNRGIEQDELLVPVAHLRDAGATVDVAAVSDDEIRTLVGDEDPGETTHPTTTLAAADASAYDLLLVPGGTLNADALRLESDAVELARAFAGAGKPIAAICHGPWLLVEADLVEGKTLTSYPSLATDIRNAGAAAWVDEPVKVCPTEGYTLITSRTPDDLDEFLGAIDDTLSQVSA